MRTFLSSAASQTACGTAEEDAGEHRSNVVRCSLWVILSQDDAITAWQRCGSVWVGLRAKAAPRFLFCFTKENKDLNYIKGARIWLAVCQRGKKGLNPNKTVVWFPKSSPIFCPCYVVSLLLLSIFNTEIASERGAGLSSQKRWRRQAVGKKKSFMQANKQNPQWATKSDVRTFNWTPTHRRYTFSNKLLSQHICSHLALSIRTETVNSLL